MDTDSITVSGTAAKKASRYLTPAQLKTVLCEQTGYVCTKSSPNHDDLYPDNKFILRGEFFDVQLDIVFIVEEDTAIVVVTQMSQHNDSLRGRFYEHVGETVSDAVEYTQA
ncbi:MAG: hypothetical protein J07HN6_00625 [Halonotius sp. J07HN6]|nr:MAG: hypothetical protein J07HN6_00625 [Halonotius sp. J07HN6]